MHVRVHEHMEDPGMQLKPENLITCMMWGQMRRLGPIACHRQDALSKVYLRVYEHMVRKSEMP